MKEETEKPHLWKDRHQEASQLHNKGESGNVYNKVTRSNAKHHKFHDTFPQCSLFQYALKRTNITFIFSRYNTIHKNTMLLNKMQYQKMT